jgi:hypothetical protein
MNHSVSQRMAVISVLLLTCLFVLPVSGDVNADAKPFISASVSPIKPVVGDPVTISGVASGANLTAGVQIWIFAGNYINVSTVTVDTAGKFSKIYNSTGLPPTTYYVLVQSPGSDGTFDIDAIDMNGYSSQIVNTKTDKTIFNFTGTGSVQDIAAVAALSEAFNQPNVDDVFTKLSFQLMSPGTPPAAPTDAAVMTPPAVSTPVQTTAKSPVSFMTLLVGICVAGLAVMKMRRE